MDDDVEGCSLSEAKDTESTRLEGDVKVDAAAFCKLWICLS